jgi:hypothetical protein
MIAEQWHLGLVVVALASNLLFVAALYLYGRRRAPEYPGDRVPGDADESPPGADPTEGGDAVVTCPDCATENERGYRYCRACVTELPAAERYDGRPDTPLQRLT